jgi:hypothetical protein
VLFEMIEERGLQVLSLTGPMHAINRSSRETNRLVCVEIGEMGTYVETHESSVPSNHGLHMTEDRGVYNN